MTHQYLQSWEVILIDDASTDATTDVVKSLGRTHHNVRDFYFDKRQERAIAYNTGIKQARGDWIYMLDSDDEVPSHFIKVVEQQIEAHPECKFMHWGSVQHHHNSGKYTKSTVDPVLDTWTWDKKFRPMSGRFIFKKELIGVTGYLPEARNAYTFAEKVRSWYPEVNNIVSPDEKNIGAPWGQDWLWFIRLLTKHGEPMKVDQLLHIGHRNHDKL